MKAIIQSVAAITIGFQMINSSTVLAGEEKISENVTQAVVEAEKQQPEQEKTEEGEASGNVEDCEQLIDSGDAQGEVDKNNLDMCDALVK